MGMPVCSDAGSLAMSPTDMMWCPKVKGSSVSREIANDANENTPLPQEPSTKELIWILGSIWLGVFLAALGHPHRVNPEGGAFAQTQALWQCHLQT
jgi:hypothetical protein